MNLRILVQQRIFTNFGTIKRAVSAYVFCLDGKVPKLGTSINQNRLESSCVHAVVMYQIPKINNLAWSRIHAFASRLICKSTDS